MKDFFELETIIEHATKSTEILETMTRAKLVIKIQEDAKILYTSSAYGEEDLIKTSIGHITAKLILLAKMSNSSLEECMNEPYLKL